MARERKNGRSKVIFGRCSAWDDARRCRKSAQVRLKGKPVCRKHYQRAYRKGGDTRTQREIESIKAKTRLSKLRAMRRGIFGGE